MKLSEFTKKYSFHDALITNILFSATTRELIIDLEVLADDTEFAVPSKMIFAGVVQYNVVEDGQEVEDIQCNDDEVLSASILPSSNGNTEIMKINLSVAVPFHRKTPRIRELCIEAESVLWVGVDVSKNK